MQPTKATRYLVRSRHAGAFLGALAGVAPIGFSLAQTASQNAVPGQGLEEITVTARKRSESLQEVPDAISVLTDEKLMAAGITDIEGVTRLTPSLTLLVPNESPGMALITIRGVGQMRNGDPPVAVVVDGVQTASTAAITQSLYDIQQIEVLKGPQGALYGRNAIGGAINITTKPPSNDFEHFLTVGFGNDDSYRATAASSGPIVADKLLYRAAVSVDSYGGSIDSGITGQPVNFNDDLNGRVRLLYRPSEAWSVDLRASASQTKAGTGNWLLLPPGDVQAENLVPMSDHVGKGERKVQEYALRIGYEVAAGELSATTGYVHSEDWAAYDLDFSPLPLFNLDLNRTETDAYNQELRFTSSDDGPLRYTFGAFVQDTKIGREMIITLLTPVVMPLPSKAENRSEAAALFAQASYALTERLDVTLAGRYDRDERRQRNLLSGFEQRATFDSLQPKVSLSYKTAPDNLLYFTAADGFRSGGFNQPSQSFPASYAQEKTRNYEVGYKFAGFDHRLRVNTAVFRTEFEDQQVFQIDLFSGTLYLMNVRDSDVTGAELETEMALSDHFTLFGGVSYLDATINDLNGSGNLDGNRAPSIPEWTYNLGFDATANFGTSLDFFLHADYSRQQGMYFEIVNTLKQRMDGTINLRTGVAGRNWRLTAYAENLLDDLYFVDVATSYQTGPIGSAGTYSVPRRFGLDLRFDF